MRQKSAFDAHPAPGRDHSEGRLIQVGVLLLGAVLYTLSTGRFLVPLAAWLAPVFLLRVARSHNARTGLALCAFVIVLGYLVAWRGVFLNGWAFVSIYTLLALVHLIPFVVDRILLRRVHGVLQWMVFPVAWASTDYLFALVSPFGTWSLVAYSQWSEPAILQLLAITGLWGFPLLIGSLASTANLAWERGCSGLAGRRPLLACAAVIAIVMVCGALRLSLHPPQQPTLTVAAISVENMKTFGSLWAPLRQPGGLSSAAARDSNSESLDLRRRLFEASARAAQAGASIIVWSEANALVSDSDENALRNEASRFAATHHVYLLAAMAVLTPGRPLARNRTLLYGPDGRQLAMYDKHHPAPGERTEPGTTPPPRIVTDGMRIAWAICYDYDFVGLLRPLQRSGADLLLDPSWDSRSIDPMHTRMAVLQAISTGAAMVRSTEDGLSIAVDGYGRVLAQQDWFSTSRNARIMLADVPRHGSYTVYDRIGDAFGWLSVAVLMLLTCSALFSRAHFHYKT